MTLFGEEITLAGEIYLIYSLVLFPKRSGCYGVPYEEYRLNTFIFLVSILTTAFGGITIIILQFYLFPFELYYWLLRLGIGRAGMQGVNKISSNQIAIYHTGGL